MTSQDMKLATAAVVGIIVGATISYFAMPVVSTTGRNTVSNSEELKMDNLSLAVDIKKVNQTTGTPQIEETLRTYNNLVKDKWIVEEDIKQKLMQRIDTQKIKENLRELTKKPHLAGTTRDEELARMIQRRFEEAGFDTSDLVPYNILLSRPNKTSPNLITMNDGQKEVFRSSFKESPIHKDDDDPDVVHAFSAHTPAGVVKTRKNVSGVIYANYGRYEDYKKLKALGVNVSGHIVIVRYGKIFRGNKIQNAEKFNATGIIIFSDPADVAAEGIEPDKVYDKTWWLPGTGMQRGFTFVGNGDPLTPGWPSTDYAYRIPEEDTLLPKIPAQPIGYSDAIQILSKLRGAVAPPEWQGGIPNFEYRLGPFFKADFQNLTLTISTHNSMEEVVSYNVIGVIKGSVEPDRYVIIGNHRDAWGFGASDPSSGTAQLLEVARVFGSLLSEEWRPRRTLVFCSWGAEEYGLIGSTEWVEEHVDKLQSRALAYFNTDTCASGPIIHVKHSPLLWKAMQDVTKLIPAVGNVSKTLFQEWKEYHEILKPKAKTKPVMETLGSGSDHAAFAFFAGIPSADIRFKRNESRYNITIYPAYHTAYDTFHMFSQFIDPRFKIIQTCCRLSSMLLKYFSDSLLIPYDLISYSSVMLEALEESAKREKMKRIYDKYESLEASVRNLLNVTQKFSSAITNVDLEPYTIRAINDQMMKFEQSFILPESLPGRPTIRHVVFGPRQFDDYATDVFPRLSHLLNDYDDLQGEEKKNREKDIKKHISDITIMTNRASSLLKELHFF